MKESINVLKEIGSNGNNSNTETKVTACDAVSAKCEASIDFVRSVLEVRYQDVVGQAAALRGAENTEEAIHDLRVASRRLRAALGEFAPYLEVQAQEDFVRRTRSITKLLGRPRELDVMGAMLAAFKLQLKGPWLEAAEHAQRAIEKSRKKAAPQCEEALGIVESADFQSAFNALLATCVSTDGCMLLVPPNRLNKRTKSLKKCRKTWQDSEDGAHLHEVRVALKKLRYACEIYEPLYGEGMRQLLHTLKRRQEALGEWNDWRMLREEVGAVAHGASYRAVQGFPLLVEQLDVQCTRRLNAFEQVDMDFEAMVKRAQKLFKAPIAPCCHWKEDR